MKVSTQVTFSSKECEMFRLPKSVACFLGQVAVLSFAASQKKAWLPPGETSVVISVVSNNPTVFFWLSFPTCVFVVGRCWKDFCFRDQLSGFVVLGGLALLYLGRSSAPGTGTSFFGAP